MKKVIFSLLVGASALLATSCMEVDNFDEPDAHFTGRIIDSTTGQNILADQGENRIRIWEKSYSISPAPQDIPVKQDGTFNNTKLFKGTYDVVAEGAWWPCDTIRVGIGKKSTEDFEVTPYLVMFDFKAEYVNDSLTMSCRFYPPIEKDLPNIREIRPFLSLNQFCGAGNSISYYNTPVDKEENPLYWKSIMKPWAGLPKLEDGKSEVYSWRLPVKPGYVYFVRIGAKVNDTHQKYNYTEIKMIEIPSE
ncbi:DUF3823 domain-containing protein [Dysgonomonas sp. 521]|uniref:DUF3823 domain-containing protein n=1 Tax=Dysgonomonas sp. 521 TaxID=2302932 RepID=UPI001626139F|nr:DUF3823 domain-containing protein [Dysgonomonas sp. 521]